METKTVNIKRATKDAVVVLLAEHNALQEQMKDLKKILGKLIVFFSFDNV